MSAAAKPELTSVVTELVEERARLEDRLAEFHRVASELGEQQLSAGAEAAVSRLRSAVGNLDTDLTRLANAVHAVAEVAGDEAKPALLVQLLFVRCGDSQFCVRVDDVKEVRSWDTRGLDSAWRERELRIVPLETALKLDRQAQGFSRKLIVLNAAPGAALLVDDVTRQDELVLRPMSPLLSGPYVGAVNGLHGEAVLVIDPAKLLGTEPGNTSPAPTLF